MFFLREKTGHRKRKIFSLFAKSKTSTFVKFPLRTSGAHITAGDTVWHDAVQKVIETHKPEVIVVNAGENQFLEGGSLVMGKADVHEVYKAAPNAKIIASHMEAVNHWTLSREELKSFANEKGISSNLLVPDDGESYTF